VPHATEMFSHPRTCPWAQRPLHLTAACFLTASMGFGWYSLGGVHDMVLLRLVPPCTHLTLVGPQLGISRAVPRHGQGEAG
jgi:hypothetical protein